MRIVVGVAGSISAYKAPFVVRMLRAQGHVVKVVATESALRFIGAATLAAISGHAVSTGVFDDPEAVEHVELGEWAELVLVAPASADLLARARMGRANDLLTATILTTTAPVVLAPAMHTQMWQNPSTVENVAVLRDRGITVIEPDDGALTSGDTGLGRLPEPARIVTEALEAVTATNSRKSLGGRRIVVSAGGTREPLDPVRFLGNRSSGRQGCAIALSAARQGAQVTLVAANIEQSLLDQTVGGAPGCIEVVKAPSALEMEQTVRSAAASADAVVMVAAVADYRPAQMASEKIKKSHDGETTLSLELVENPDILAGLVQNPPRSGQLVVGFAAETGDADGDVLTHGAQKARRKGADLLVVNQVGVYAGFGDVPNQITVLNREGQEVMRSAGTKAEVAQDLVAIIAQSL